MCTNNDDMYVWLKFIVNYGCGSAISRHLIVMLCHFLACTATSFAFDCTSLLFTAAALSSNVISLVFAYISPIIDYYLIAIDVTACFIQSCHCNLFVLGNKLLALRVLVISLNAHIISYQFTQMQVASTHTLLSCKVISCVWRAFWCDKMACQCHQLSLH